MLLRARGLAIIRGERLLLRGIDLDLADGEATVLIGPNGAGKSSLIRVLAGLRRPDGGTLTWDGEPVFDDPVAHARRVAFLGPLDALKPGLTAGENLRLAAALCGTRPGAVAGAIADAIEAVGLAAFAAFPARHLSSGQKRRVAIARLLLSRAPLFLLDEPTNGLDRDAVATLGTLLASHRARGGAVIAATHLALPLPDAGTLALGEAGASGEAGAA